MKPTVKIPDFKEVQRFRQPWLWLVVMASGLVPVIIFGSGIWIQLVKGQKFGTNPMSDTGLVITFTLVTVLCAGLCLLFGIARLTTVIGVKGVSVKFFPFHMKSREIGWEQVESCSVIRYSPIGDYGGWGIRTGRKGKAYNVSGDKGLMLVMNNGRNFLIGTSCEREMTEYLEKLFRENEIDRRYE